MSAELEQKASELSMGAGMGYEPESDNLVRIEEEKRAPQNLGPAEGKNWIYFWLYV